MAETTFQDIIERMELVSQDDLDQALAVVREKGEDLGDVLMDMGFIAYNQLLQTRVAQQMVEDYGLEVVNLDSLEPEKEALEKVSSEVAWDFYVVPVRMEGEVLVVAVAPDYYRLAHRFSNVIEDLGDILDRDVKGVITSEEAVQKWLDEYYPKAHRRLVKEKSIEEILDSYYEEVENLNQRDDEDFEGEESREVQIKNATLDLISRLFNQILLTTFQKRASDVHFEPHFQDFKIRYRVDGKLHQLTSLPKELAEPLVKRTKELANLDTGESRHPQEGSVSLQLGGKSFELFVSSLPHMYGESVVLQVSYPGRITFDLQALGLPGDQVGIIREALSLPQGMVVVNGTPRSGRNTTLYSALNHLNTVDRKIITLERECEYEMPGLIQCWWSEEMGFAYRDFFRSVLAQEPDVILIEEIKTREVAQMALKAAITGKLVLVKMDLGRDVFTPVEYFLRFGIPSSLVASALKLVISQTLVRKICRKCKENAYPTEEMALALGVDFSRIEGKTFSYGKGCEKCNYSGYWGRMAVAELVRLNPQLQRLVLEEASPQEFREKASAEDYCSLTESGLIALERGLTTVDELVKNVLY